MSFSSSSSQTSNVPSGGRPRLGLTLAAVFSILASGCFNSPKIDPTQTRHCKDDKSCPWGSVCGANGICCESADGKTCKVPPPSGGLDALAIDTSPVYDIAIREAGLGTGGAAGIEGGQGTGGAPGWDGSVDTGTDLPLPGPEAGTGGIPGTGGTSAIDAPATDTIDAPLAGTGGILGAGGAGGKGGTTGSGGGAGSTGGAPGSGGTVATGGVVGTGGITGTGGATTCQPKSRDCTSSLDNNCNGTPDNQETTYCACPVGQSRACQEHPGYDGVGICKAGSQTCAASSDKSTSSWAACTGSVGPGAEVCDAAGLDENCNGQSNEGCECVNGTSIPCDCGPATTCTNGKKGTCSVSKVTMNLDSDHDNYGDPARPALVCPNAAGYVSNADDCNDSDPTFKPGVSVCATNNITRNWCVSGGGGVTKSEACDQGCYNGVCRNDGTVGLPGYVTCFGIRCSTYDGCDTSARACSDGTITGYINCDGPNDCGPGESCCASNNFGGVSARCMAGACLGANSNEFQVCDPLANTCNCAPTVLNNGYTTFACP